MCKAGHSRASAEPGPAVGRRQRDGDLGVGGGQGSDPTHRRHCPAQSPRLSRGNDRRGDVLAERVRVRWVTPHPSAPPFPVSSGGRSLVTRDSVQMSPLPEGSAAAPACNPPIRPPPACALRHSRWVVYLLNARCSPRRALGRFIRRMNERMNE